MSSGCLRQGFTFQSHQRSPHRLTLKRVTGRQGLGDLCFRRQLGLVIQSLVRGRVDLRFAEDSAGELYVLTKSDGMIRQVVGLR